jgi:hypothetical protein
VKVVLQFLENAASLIAAGRCGASFPPPEGDPARKGVRDGRENGGCHAGQGGKEFHDVAAVQDQFLQGNARVLSAVPGRSGGGAGCCVPLRVNHGSVILSVSISSIARARRLTPGWRETAELMEVSIEAGFFRIALTIP